ncbi:MAG: YbdK family carboxylate-amine ligase [Solirubrobacteraceae bacterium]|nr:YbdK family carboxylate-amine ligase [Solirubrobacteraceae bacterium]
MPERLPAWAWWSARARERAWTVGVEEEVMLLDARTWLPANRVEDVLAALAPSMAARASAETHACVVELKTDVHVHVAGLAAELAALRRALDGIARDRLGLRVAAAGTHPLASGSEVRVSSGPRYRKIASTTRALAHREPTMALHVHVGVPDAAQAVRALDGLRGDLPLLLALSANSPYWRGRDSGFASVRTPLFSMFPRVGIPRRFGTYVEYVRVVDALLRSGAIPEPTFLWWDARLQPRLGTVEVRIMDSQSRLGDTAALAAVVQCLVRRRAEGPPASALDPEVLSENRFLAARDGMRARTIDALGTLRPVRAALAEALTACRPIAASLNCARELAGAALLAADPGYVRQRSLAAQNGLAALPACLAADFVTEGRCVSAV